MTNPRIKFTVKDYMSTPDDQRYQLLDGELVLAPSPTTRHQTICLELSLPLSNFVKANQLGTVFIAPMDVFFSENDVAQPDILFVSNARSRIITEPNIQGAPDLVVEILSPGTVSYDRGYKRDLYGQHGVLEYWLVDPGVNSVEVLALGETGFATAATYSRESVLASPLLTGLSIDLGPIFAT